ncbi:Oligopeptide transport system permease OppC [Klebsiella pneumoniae]|uniref:Oligopeptide transport system permease OppC n=1 Tax=Klebsiella pneumoniae TaxID=573 RepID=A0A378AMC4_KLEPN|nr:Oligopeptide transport system permease OppC [Klebsiella pneumoniae]
MAVLILFLCSLGAELLANDRPLLVQYRGQLYVPVLKNYTEQTFGGAFATAADYQDPWLQHQLATHGWALWPPVRFGATTINFASTVPFPSPPSASNWLGTDRQRRRCAGAESSMGHASRCSSVCC